MEKNWKFSKFQKKFKKIEKKLEKKWKYVVKDKKKCDRMKKKSSQTNISVKSYETYKFLPKIHQNMQFLANLRPILQNFLQPWWKLTVQTTKNRLWNRTIDPFCLQQWSHCVFNNKLYFGRKTQQKVDLSLTFFAKTCKYLFSNWNSHVFGPFWGIWDHFFKYFFKHDEKMKKEKSKKKEKWNFSKF